MTKTPAKVLASSLIVRSTDPKFDDYREYKPLLRKDFFHSCAYCTMTEAEAQAIRFTIDHYEPQKARPDLVLAYHNLMYACDECNLRKSDRSPPESARKDGYRFFCADIDEFQDHFEQSEVRINPKTKIADYTIESLDLNRAALRRLRELRKRLWDCEEAVMQGILALRGAHLDRLPPKLRGQILTAIRGAQGAAASIANEIDKVLHTLTKSDLIDEDPESEARAKERALKLDGWKALHPGSWRGPRKTKKKA
ncbi:HNH endonuclease [Bradyrhizobium barranii]|uniref:HNH endonuclease n=1 Tax=Bradyrhizobium barranii TaxID=2992140 RepID=A0ABY3QYH2_9BRAD|nr:HNH endonuclease [Bradyrhizobium japonicum]UFW91071.1 HNH endonuclease [Bradyrhizobium japonicum]